MDNRRPLSPVSDTPRFGTPRRRFTSPTSSAPPPSTPARASSHITSPGSSNLPHTPTSGANSPSTFGTGEKDGNIEILFSHPLAKVINFTVSPNALKEPDLSWRGPEERTIASGPLRIYRTMPQEVAFLQSGSALRPLLKRTQCWNVDGNRIFCLQLRPGNYWRIEIWGPEEEQPSQIEKFKETMTSIIAYEMTPCPFIRAAECEPLVEHPELMTPARVWSRAHLRRVSDTPTPPIEGFSFLDIRPSEPAHDTRSVKSGGDERPRRNIDIQDERDCKSDYSSGSTAGVSLVSQRVKLLEACNELEEPMDLSTGRKWERPMSPDGEDDSMEDMDKAKALPHAVAAVARERALRRRSTTAGDFGSGHRQPLDTPSPASSRRPSSATPPRPQFEPINKWLEFTPPVSPLGGAQPDATPSETGSSLPASPTARISSHRQPAEPLPHLELTPAAIEEGEEETPSTPSLAFESSSSSSCASFDSDFPIDYRPQPYVLVDPRSNPPLRRNTAASLGLTQKAHEPATSASYVILKPKTFVVSRMVEIATRLDMTGGITGASFIVNQQGEVKWRDEVDPLEGWGLGVPPGTPLESLGEGLWIAREEALEGVDH